MSANSSIEWTDHTFNIAWGCIKVSRECDHCYAATFAKRTGHDVWGPAKTTARRTLSDSYWAQPLKWEAEAAADPSGGVAPNIPGRLVFCSSMADVFEDHPTIAEEREYLWPLIRQTPHLTWLLLTKRPERIAANLPLDWGEEGYPNVGLGTSAGGQEWAWRVGELSKVAARFRFVSAEPLLAGLSFFSVLRKSLIDWVIIGGESGAGARPFDIDWARRLVTACRMFGVAPFVKQLGAVPMMSESEWHAFPQSAVPLLNARNARRVPDGYVPLKLNDAKGGVMEEWPSDLRIREFPTITKAVA